MKGESYLFHIGYVTKTMYGSIQNIFLCSFITRNIKAHQTKSITLTASVNLHCNSTDINEISSRIHTVNFTENFFLLIILYMENRNIQAIPRDFLKFSVKCCLLS